MKNNIISVLTILVVIAATACTKNIDPNVASSGGNSVASVGSTARFAISNNRLYALEKNTVTVVDIADPKNLAIMTRQNLNQTLETIFPFGDALFIGTTNGVYGYNISNPNLLTNPRFINHLRACDPVVANDKNMYLTLRSGTACNTANNMLQHYTYTLPSSNEVQMQYVGQQTMLSPRGLALANNNLFVCDVPEGIKVYTIGADGAPNYERTQSMDGYECYDMIPRGNNLIVQHNKGVSFCDIADPVGNFKVLKTIE
jgi:hypothetical protein